MRALAGFGADGGLHWRERRSDGAGSKHGDELGSIGIRFAGIGLTVNELATGIGASLGSVRVWVYTVGKKVNGLKKIGPGRFALSS